VSRAAPKLYTELADWYYHLTHPDDYEEEAGIFHRTFEQHTRIPIRTVLELGSGGGANASYLKRHYDMTLTDLSERMLAQSKTINPDCRHVVGDMRTLRLGELFDAVFVHDAIAYMTTEPDLGAAISTAAAHVRPGGMALFVPDDLAETYQPSISDGGHEFGGRSLQYTQEHGPLAPGSTVVETRFTYTLRDATGAVRVEEDVHLNGVFSESTWLTLMRGAGLEPLVLPFVHSEVEHELKMFVGLRPA
jgi:trans-aconitate methyltransferase